MATWHYANQEHIRPVEVRSTYTLVGACKFLINQESLTCRLRNVHESQPSATAQWRPCECLHGYGIMQERSELSKEK